ncbi:SpoVA/SpoVAEb family sporulation membrane protein [Anoxybacteroides tepidamans]|uniref:SpoVA/SpoVAEb family sporulation membrane protein n=1 Tax=Anoxybacteroides tepidamans TaxID=265948 RepID=UPI000486A2F0|nr:SpoVA/SpoVAEb family sporulation membrane protein [Anoxybacillus tepidamans]
MSLRKNYQHAVKQFQPKPSYIANSLKAFISGGLLCACGEALRKLYMNGFNVSAVNADHLMMLTIILLAVLFTALGVYDTFSQFAGAGATILLSGFANSLASAAIEHRSEGWVGGVANQMFKVGGAVIVYGVVVAFVLGVVHYIV